MRLIVLSFLGCGSGLSGETLSENGHQWIGLDISKSMLGKCTITLVEVGIFLGDLFVLVSIHKPYLFYIADVALEREVEGDLLLSDMGQVFT